MASPRLRAIIITRSRNVSSSSARGSVVMVTSAVGMSARMARVSRSLMAATRSSGSVRLTPTPRSTNKHRAGRPRAHALDGNNSRHLARDRRHALAHAGRRRVGQGVDGPPPEPPAGDADEYGDDDRRRGIGPGKAERDAAKADQHRDRRPHVGEKMQRIGFERLAGGFLGDATERARAKKIDHDRARDDRRTPRVSPRPRASARR